MTTEIPEGIATPNTLDTRIGELRFFDGVPEKETQQKVYDYIDFHCGVEAFLKGIQIASMEAMKRGLLSFGPANYTAVLYENLMDSKALWLTPNTTSVYMATWLMLGDEPMVIETPPDVLGIIDDHWFNYVADFGAASVRTMMSKPMAFRSYLFEHEGVRLMDAKFIGKGSQYAVAYSDSDGSYDIYFGPSAPAGQENNWIQTVPGKGWNTIFRLYGPLEPWFEKTWQPGEPKLII